VASEVDAFGQAAPDELCGQREQPEGEPGKKARMLVRPSHHRY
jgi:hypothetical protein